jgi:hypothetical protein
MSTLRTGLGGLPLRVVPVADGVLVEDGAFDQVLPGLGVPGVDVPGFVVDDAPPLGDRPVERLESEDVVLVARAISHPAPKPKNTTRRVAIATIRTRGDMTASSSVLTSTRDRPPPLIPASTPHRPTFAILRLKAARATMTATASDGPAGSATRKPGEKALPRRPRLRGPAFTRIDERGFACPAAR